MCSFGAVVSYEQLRATPDPVAAGVDFFHRGLQLLNDVRP